MFDVDPPRTTADLRQSLTSLHSEGALFLDETFDDDGFFTPQGEFWSPAGHLRHLIKSERPLIRAMQLPRLLIRLRFGRASEASRSYEEVRDVYHRALEDGSAQAGRFAPSSRKPDLEPPAWRTRLMEQWIEGGEALDEAISSWSERALDRLRLPHPVLGPMTVREMLHFTVVHDAHHLRRVDERRNA